MSHLCLQGSLLDGAQRFCRFCDGPTQTRHEYHTIKNEARMAACTPMTKRLKTQTRIGKKCIWAVTASLIPIEKEQGK